MRLDCFGSHLLKTVSILFASILINGFAYALPPKQSDDLAKQHQQAFNSYLNVATADDEALNQTLEYLEQNLVELETEHGPYHITITENLINQARIYSERNEHAEARSVIERALEVQRISYGLNGAGQIPIVEQLILVNRILEKWSDLNKNYELLYWLYRRVYGENTPELLPVLGRFIEWKIEAINGGLFGNRKSLLQKALSSAKLANNIIKNHPEQQQYSNYFLRLESILRRANNEETAQNFSRF
jgi:Na+-transporting NADH:ubiquinone oxidoreductase subunit NqrC